MKHKRHKRAVLHLVLSVGLWTSTNALAYTPHPYTPVTNSPAELAEKQLALDALRTEWTGDDYTSSQILSILSAKGIPDPTAIPAHFNGDGSWYKSLPTGASFSESQYALNAEYVFELLALAYLDEYLAQDHAQTIYDSLAWYFDNGHAAPHQYHETFNYHNPEATIGGTMVLVGLLMYDEIHTDRVGDPAVEAVFQQMREFGRAFINASPQIRGPNWSFRIDNCLRYVLFTDDVYDMDEYAYHWNQALSFNRWEEETDGVHPDWSMMHHGDMNYWGMYGISWTSRVIEFGELFADKPWAYETPQLDFIANTMIEGTRWVLFRGVCEYTSAPKRGTMLLARTDSVAESFKEIYVRLIALGGNQLTRLNQLIDLEANAFLPPWTTEGAAQTGQPEFAGHRYYWTTEYQVHRRPNFGIYVRRCSQRTRSPEDSSISTSKMHLHYGTGYTPILRRGDEVRFSRLCWDFQHVPGTTVEQGKAINSGKAGSTKRGLNLFSGGVSDGWYGCGSFDQQLVEFNNDNSGNYSYINGAGALKSTFFFDEGMVALGQNIRRIATVGGTQNTMLTTLNNVRRLTDVIYSVNGSAAATVSPGTPLEQRFSVTSSAWFWHDGMGYVIWPSADPSTELVVSLGDRAFNSVLQTDPDFQSRVKAELGTAAWDAGVFDMFRLWIDHGVNPSSDTYAYAVLPDCTPQEVEDYAAQPPIVMQNNTPGIQSVFDDVTGLYYAIFKQAGTVDFGGGRSIQVDRPLMVMARKDNEGNLNLSAANPQHVGLRRPFVPGSGATIGILYDTPDSITINGFGVNGVLTVDLPTARGEEGRSVHAAGTPLPKPALLPFVDWEFDALGTNGTDSGSTATDWQTLTPETASPAWVVTQLGAGAGSGIEADYNNSRLVLTGAGGGDSEAILPFGESHGRGRVSAALGLNSGSTWSGAKFNLIHIAGSLTNTLIELNAQRNGDNANNLITTGSTNISINGTWEDVFHSLEIEWDQYACNISLIGLEGGPIEVEAADFLLPLAPNALLLQVDAKDDGRTRRFQIDRLHIDLPMPNYWEWMAAFGITNAPYVETSFDIDGDGYDNLSEYISGTHPNDSAKNPSFTEAYTDQSGSTFYVHWNPVQGRVYDLYSTDQLMEGFSCTQSNMSYPINVYSNAISATNSAGFFQLKVRLKP